MKAIVTKTQVWLDGKQIGHKICVTVAEETEQRWMYTEVRGAVDHESWSNDCMEEELKLAKMQAEHRFGKQTGNNFTVRNSKIILVRPIPIGQLMLTENGYKCLTPKLALDLMVKWAKSHIR